MRALYAGFAVLSLVAACGGRNNGDDDGDSGDGDSGGDGGNACVGLECQVVDCAKQGLPSTTLTGTIFAPNGTLPLYGVNIYVPREMPGPFTDGAQCSRCTDSLSGSPLVQVQSDDAGKFRLEGVPAGDNIPLVITSGKWRRQVTIPKVDACVEAQLTADNTRLPKNKAEGDIPKIALTTGGADSLECLVRKIGIDLSEITTDAGAGRVHFYAGTDGVNSFAAGGTFPNAQTLWNDEAKLKQYDIVFLSCEGGQNPATKTQAAMNNLKAYADIGGRVFASHWHNVWIGGEFQNNGPDRPQVWNTIATWSATNSATPTTDVIDETGNPKGTAFAQWMLNVMGSTTRGVIPLQANTGRVTTTGLMAGRSERWVFTQGGGMTPQMFQFTTPNEQPSEQRCGKVVFTDMHVSGDPGGSSGNRPPFPNSPNCQAALTPQEKALAFMFFDIASCVGPIF